MKKCLFVLSCFGIICLFVCLFSAHQYTRGAEERGAVEDGGGADNEAQHDQAVDHKVLQGVPPGDIVVGDMLCHVSCVMCHVSFVMCPVSYVMCHVSCVICHVSCVMYHVSCVMCHVSFVINHV